MTRLAFRFLVLPLLLASATIAPVMAGGEFTVVKSVVEDVKAVFATVETADVINARARIGGTPGKLSVDEGSRVRKGQVIATVGDPKLKLRMDALKADEVITEGIGKALTKEFIELKTQEWIDYHRDVTDWEVQRYLEFY